MLLEKILSNKKYNIRYIKSLKTTIAAFISRLTNIICGVIVAPIIISYSSVEMFGYWLTITSIIGILVIADIGIGSALVNTISAENFEKNIKKINSIISTALYSLILIGISLLIILIIIYCHVDIKNLLLLSSELNQIEINAILLLSILIFCINIPLNVISQIQLGFYDAYICEYFRTIGYVLGTIYLFIAVNNNFPLYLILFGYSGMPVLANLLNMVFYYINKKELFLKLNYFNFADLKKLLSSGIVFFLITLANIFGTSLDNYIIASNIGASDVAVFAITKQMFSVLYFIVLISSPYWPVFSEAINKKNFFEINKLIINLNIITIIPTIIICVILIFWGQSIIHLWIKDISIPSLQLLIAFAFFWVISCTAQPIIYLMQVERFKILLLILTFLFAISSLILKNICIQYFGLEGVMWINSFTYLLFFVLPAYYICINKLNFEKRI